MAESASKGAARLKKVSELYYADEGLEILTEHGRVETVHEGDQEWRRHDDEENVG